MDQFSKIENGKLCMMEDYTKCRRLRWFRYLKRMGSDRIPNIIIELNAVGWRMGGKPKEQWLARVRGSMISRKLKEDAEDREL